MMVRLPRRTASVRGSTRAMLPAEGAFAAIDQARFTAGIERLTIGLPGQSERPRLHCDAPLGGAGWTVEKHFRGRQDGHRRAVRRDRHVLWPGAIDPQDFPDGHDDL